MTTALLDDELWVLIEPLLPVRKRRYHHPGRKRLDDRRTLTGILFVLRTPGSNFRSNSVTAPG